MRTAFVGILLLLVWLGPAERGIAQLPRSLSFQGYLTNSAGAPLEGSQDITIKLFDASAGGAQLWSRVYNGVSVTDGVFGIALEAGTPALDEVSFDQPRWLEATVGGQVISPRTQLRASPFALSLSLPIDAKGNIGALNASALKITNTATTGPNTAIYGVSNSTTGKALNGWATASSGLAYGVNGESSSSTGRGIFGLAASSSGTNYGVYGQSNSTSGTGVHGHATAVTGFGTTGVSGFVDTPDGRGVLGFARALTGSSYGVFGKTASTTGTGVGALAENTSGSNIGVHGQTWSTSGTGVKGSAVADSGLTFGVLGFASSPTGWGGFFWGGRGTHTRGAQNSDPDLVLGGNSASNDDGRIASDPDYPSSDIWIESNDAVVIVLDRDGGGDDSDFEIRDKDGVNIFNVDESGTVTADGVIVHSSDRNRKEDIVPADPSAILEEIARLPVHHWRFKGEPEAHIGPMAQDFYAAFGLGADDKHIAGSDANGVALAAIQALYEIVMRQQAEIERMKNED